MDRAVLYKHAILKISWRFVSQFVGEPECSPQVFQITGNKCKQRMSKKSSSKKQLDAAIEQAKPSPLNMPKKSSSKKPIQKQENEDAEQAKTSSTQKNLLQI
ncbi:hypothetical protein DKX38_010481 [Salix brachista]|uniref:Uncharacterized protein n=1 Tax=Salix brachista TaxID=2182728 RepID=A0A5N5MDA4_9ROSI|nr:hypothetical protein DKX38_010481 [Salix brachista]